MRLALLVLLISAAIGCSTRKAVLVMATPNVVVVRQEPGQYIIYSRSMLAAQDAADEYLKCRERPCVIGTGGVLLEVEVPIERD